MATFFLAFAPPLKKGIIGPVVGQRFLILVDHLMRLSILSVCVRIQFAAMVALICTASSANYSFTKVADTSTSTAGGTITGILIPPAIDGSDVAFQAGISTSELGIFMGNGGPLTTIVKTGDPAPVGEFSFLGTVAPSVSNAQVAFYGAFGSGAGSGQSIFIGNGIDLTPIALQGIPVGNTTVSGGGYPVLFSNGNLAFQGSLSSGGVGILYGNASSLSLIVKSGDAAPEGTFSSSFGSLATSGNKVAFVGRYGGNYGIFYGNGGPLTTVVKEGDPAPIGEFTVVGDPAISGDSVAFVGRYSSIDGVFVRDADGLIKIASKGDVTSAGVLTNVAAPAISGKTIAFRGEFDGGNGVFIGEGADLTTVIASGDLLFGHTVVDINFASGLDPRGSGNIAFAYRLSNGVRGIALAAPVPEPNSASIIAMMIIALLGHRRQR